MTNSGDHSDDHLEDDARRVLQTAARDAEHAPRKPFSRGPKGVGQGAVIVIVGLVLFYLALRLASWWTLR